MQRIEYIEIGNRIYAMCFSIGARKAIEEKYGSIREYISKCENEETVTDAYLDGLEIMTRYGAARINELGTETVKEHGAIDEDGSWHGISKEKLEVLLCAGDSQMIGAKIIAAINKAAVKEVKVTPTPEARKNSNTAHEATA